MYIIQFYLFFYFILFFLFFNFFSGQLFIDVKSRKQVVAKNNRNRSRKTTTTLTYKHSNLLKKHTHTQNQKGEKNNKECADVQKVNKIKNTKKN